MPIVSVVFRVRRCRPELIHAVLLVCFSLSACSDHQGGPLAPGVSKATSRAIARSLTLALPTSNSVADRYIVLLKDNATSISAVALDLTSVEGAAVHYLYSRTLKGFAATLPPDAVDRARAHPLVDRVLPDAEVGLSGGLGDGVLTASTNGSFPLIAPSRPWVTEEMVSTSTSWTPASSVATKHSATVW